MSQIKRTKRQQQNTENGLRKHRSVNYDMGKYTPDENAGLYVVRAKQCKGKENNLTFSNSNTGLSKSKDICEYGTLKCAIC